MTNIDLADEDSTVSPSSQEGGLQPQAQRSDKTAPPTTAPITKTPGLVPGSNFGPYKIESKLG